MYTIHGRIQYNEDGDGRRKSAYVECEAGCNHPEDNFAVCQENGEWSKSLLCQC